MSREETFLGLTAAGLLVLALLLAAGCERPQQYPRWEQSRAERLALFADVEKLAVVPFRDESGGRDLDAARLTEIFADEIVRRARFKVLYPPEVLAAAEQSNREALERARAEKRAPAADELIALARSELDAVAAGRAAGADAVLVGRVSSFDPYPPKRLALTVRVYLCAAPRPSAWDMIEMTDDGVPVEITSPRLRERFIWERQKHYSADRKNTQTGMDWYARKFERIRGFGDEVFYYSTDKFLCFVAWDITDILYDEAQWYKRRRAKPEPAATAAAGDPAAIW